MQAIAGLGAMAVLAGAAAGCGRPQTARERSSRGGSSACPSAQDVRAGVYDPDRLRVLNGCQRVTGTVKSESPTVEHDGDVHFDTAVDPPYSRLLSPGNFEDQRGWLVVELTPRDGSHLPRPSIGDRVALVGVWVNDSQHSWHEIHPVFFESINGGRVHISGPQYGGGPPSDRSSDAADDCRTPAGALCTGY